MISFPTVLNPWYVVVQVGASGDYIYYRNKEEDESDELIWTNYPKRASLFLSLNSAARIAKVENADILALWDKDQLGKYGREVS